MLIPMLSLCHPYQSLLDIVIYPVSLLRGDAGFGKLDNLSEQPSAPCTVDED